MDMTKIKDVVEQIANAVIAQKEYLNMLDRAIGDGDHGNNMAIGFQAALEDIEKLEDDNDPREVLKAIGTAFAENVGGAAGPLYAAAFNRAAKACEPGMAFTIDSVITVLGAAVEAVKKRGRVKPGEKTMLDVLLPVYNVFVKGKENDMTLFQCLGEASRAAKEGADYTRTISASKGRASYLGIRSIGHQDPGATSSLIMVRELYNFFQR